jgi:hypothetical protein
VKLLIDNAVAPAVDELLRSKRIVAYCRGACRWRTSAYPSPTKPSLSSGPKALAPSASDAATPMGACRPIPERAC